jgi:hypothetical protein
MNVMKLMKIFLVAVLLLVGYVIGFTSSSFSSANTVIEYKVIRFDHFAGSNELENELNRMGAKGWDLVNFGKYMAVLKR